MNKLKALLEQLRGLDPNDPGRWPMGVRLGTALLLFSLAAAGGYYFFQSTANTGSIPIRTSRSAACRRPRWSRTCAPIISTDFSRPIR